MGRIAASGAGRVAPIARPARWRRGPTGAARPRAVRSRDASQPAPPRRRSRARGSSIAVGVDPGSQQGADRAAARGPPARRGTRVGRRPVGATPTWSRSWPSLTPATRQPGEPRRPPPAGADAEQIGGATTLTSAEAAAPAPAGRRRAPAPPARCCRPGQRVELHGRVARRRRRPRPRRPTSRGEDLNTPQQVGLATTPAHGQLDTGAVRVET